VLIPIPLAALYLGAADANLETGESIETAGLLGRSLILAGGVAAIAVVLGYAPGRVLGTTTGSRAKLLVALLIPLLLPRYVLYYGWSLLLSPTTELGRFLSTHPEIARAVGSISASLVMILWYWPLTSILIAHGFASVDREAWSLGRLDAGPVRRFSSVTLPLLSRPLCLSWAICFVWVLSEFATFHLAGVRTVGTELAVMYELTGSATAVARAAWPLVVVALAVGIWLWRRTRRLAVNPPTGASGPTPRRWQWVIVGVLWTATLLVPVALLLGNWTDLSPLRNAVRVHLDGLGWSLLVAVLAGALSLLLAGGAMVAARLGPAGRWLGPTAYAITFMAMFLPGSLVAMALLNLVGRLGLASSLGQSWLLVSIGQAVRFAGLALVVLHLLDDSQQQHFAEMAAVDGASRWQSWRHVRWPRQWPALVGIALLVTMLSATELSATMVLLPAGLPDFAQRLLNQMHYARDQEVITSCLLLVCLCLALIMGVVMLARATRLRSALFVLAFTPLVLLAGCESQRSGGPKVLGAFGRTGRGRVEFIYPRAIARCADGTLLVVDKTGRIQRLSPSGEFLSSFRMPKIEAGKPTGISMGPDGNLYVADTHYHRVMVYSLQGQRLGEFGKFGEGDGEFIYPTDVAFASDGRIFVSEYGGNDRVSIFSPDGAFLGSFGGPGNEGGALSRPSALCVDARRRRLYVADACNHRIAIYSLAGRFEGTIGSVGRGQGQLRYPYDLALTEGGELVVCEYGNNRIQLFSPDGRSLGTYGQPGRELGQLAYPWAVAVGEDGRVFVVDSGNNRVQVWRL